MTDNNTSNTNMPDFGEGLRKIFLAGVGALAATAEKAHFAEPAFAGSTGVLSASSSESTTDLTVCCTWSLMPAAASRTVCVASCACSLRLADFSLALCASSLPSRYDPGGVLVCL